MVELIIIGVCLVLNALFAAAEMAFVSVPKSELRRVAKERNTAAATLLKLRENPERTLSVIQVGITLVGAISAAVGGAGASESIEPFLIENGGLSETTAELLSIGLIVLPLTYVNVVIGELVPKSLALQNSLGLALTSARWLALADQLFSPIVTGLERSTKVLLRTVFPRSKPGAAAPEQTLEISSLVQHHQQAVLNLAHIETKKIQDIFLPWRDVAFARVQDPMETVAPIIFASGHTRLPVCDESGAVIGVLHTKECLALRETGSSDWRSLIRPILAAQPQDSILTVLRQMQKNRNHMAFVTTGSEPPLGIVTLEDISEEIWGDIYDEDDDSRVRKLFAERLRGRVTPIR